MTAFRPGQSPPPVRTPIRTGCSFDGRAPTIRHDVLTFASSGVSPVKEDAPYAGRLIRHDVQTSCHPVPLIRGQPRVRTEVPLGARAPAPTGGRPPRAHPPPAR